MAPNRLDDGDRLPSLTAPVVGDGEITLPDDVEGSWSLIVFYRGHW
ncbi:MAG: hypothetical protein ACODAB_01175 [Gemmatimonadota bacterium]